MEKTKFCQKCGNRIDEEAEICPKCGVRQAVKSGKKDPNIAALLSFLVVGAGQAYNGEWGKAVILFIGAAIAFAIGIMTIICLPVWLVVWIYGIYDAYMTAKKMIGAV